MWWSGQRGKPAGYPPCRTNTIHPQPETCPEPGNPALSDTRTTMTDLFHLLFNLVVSSSYPACYQEKTADHPPGHPMRVCTLLHLPLP
jgi:hypothetical protein